MQTQMNVARNYQQQICENVLAAITKTEQDDASALEQLLAHWPDTPRENALCMLRVRGFVTKIKRGVPYVPHVTEEGYEFLRTGVLPDLETTLDARDAAMRANWKSNHASA